jgi:hypothetical protein
MAIVTSSLMSDHQNYVRLCSLLNIAKLALLTIQVANFAPAFHAREGGIWNSLTNLPRLAEDQNQPGWAANQHITHLPQKNYALVADSSIWLLALYLPVSVLIFCGQFCTLVKKFTNTFFT